MIWVGQRYGDDPLKSDSRSAEIEVESENQIETRDSVERSVSTDSQESTLSQPQVFYNTLSLRCLLLNCLGNDTRKRMTSMEGARELLLSAAQDSGIDLNRQSPDTREEGPELRSMYLRLRY